MHNEVKAMFIDSMQEGEYHRAGKDEGGMLRQFIQSKMEDNPSINTEEYEQKLSGLGDPALIKAMRDGDWDIVAGGMFDSVWEKKTHVIEQFKIPNSWYIDRSFDWGSSAPFSVGWWAESDGTEVQLSNGNFRTFPKGTLFRIAEWYGWQNKKPNVGMGISDQKIAEGISNIEGMLLQKGGVLEHHFRVNPGPADSSIFDVNNNDDSIHKTFESCGISFVKADKSPGSRIRGWSLTRSRLEASTEWPMENKGIFFFSTCVDGAIRTLPVAPRDDRKQEDIDTNYEDHALDEIRYRVLAGRPAELIIKEVMGL